MEDTTEVFIPSFGKMKVAMYIVVILLWVVVMQLNTTVIEVDPFLVWGLLGLLLWIGGFEVFLPRAKNKSPKGITNVLADTIASGPPQMVIRSEGPFPELGVWVLGTIEAPRYGLKFYATATGYAICPTMFAYKYGPNTVWNVDFKMYLDHGTLPPHVYEELRNMIEPTKYKPNLPVVFGLFPAMIHELSKSDKHDLQVELKALDMQENVADKVGAVAKIVERFAAIAAPFKYEEDVLKAEARHKARLEYVSKQYDLVREELKDQESLTAKWKRASLPPRHPQEESLIKKLTTGRKDDQGEQDYERS